MGGVLLSVVDGSVNCEAGSSGERASSLPSYLGSIYVCATCVTPRRSKSVPTKLDLVPSLLT